MQKKPSVSLWQRAFGIHLYASPPHTSGWDFPGMNTLFN
jgi:hypothetical protein